MPQNGLVSTIVPFLNEESFFREAIESVFAQTYSAWELLLINDGSTDGSVGIARDYAESHPEKVRYIEHSDRRNHGVSASRNLGLRFANGQYVAFLDGDDVCSPNKLQRQVELLECERHAAMVCGDAQWWYSWTGRPEDIRRDYTPASGVEGNALLAPPALLTMFLNGEARVPCMSSLLVRREVIEAVGGFDERFQIYEDQAFYAKICARMPVFVAAECWSRYRQHPNSACARAKKKGEREAIRLRYLEWLDEYLSAQRIKDPALWRALKRKQFRHKHPTVLRTMGRALNGLMRPVRAVHRLTRRADKGMS